MKHFITLFATLLALYSCADQNVTGVKPADISLSTSVRPSATPLITVDPYFSIWSPADRLNETATVHWTGVESPLLGLVRVDGQSYRILGADSQTQAAEQTSLSVLPTRTVAGFACGPVHIDLIFTAPLFLEDLDLVSRPVNYVTYQATSTDRAKHNVQIYFSASPKQAVNTPDQAVTARSGQQDDMAYAMAGTVEQPVLQKKGDDIRIDWGYVYLASRNGKGDVAVTPYSESVTTFTESGCQAAGLTECTRDSTDDNPVILSYVNDLGKVGKQTVADFIILAYDDIRSVQFFGENLRPYWNRNDDKTITGQIALASEQYDTLMKRCAAFDSQLMNDAFISGGKEYSELCALAYRQAIAAHKLVESPDAGLLFLSKENFSNGSIGTVDVTYPSAPLFLLYNTDLAKGLMNHIYYYSESGRWTKPFAAHDVGTYPHANGQTYGGDMPVEECGNMLILTGAVAKIDGNADYALKHWGALTTWVKYLEKYGLDPANQLCTDDFAGHFAHNTNLSIKAIMGIESYGMLANMLGMSNDARKYHAMAKDMAAKWKKMAADSDHYRLTFDKSGTWSQKYNLVWDRIFGSNVFDTEIAATEIAYYKEKQNRYGLPLDNRKTYTKTDWIIWTATMADSKDDFETFIKPIYLFQNETTDRIPMSDWIYTDSTSHVGFQARSVVGGYFIKLLSDFSQVQK